MKKMLDIINAGPLLPILEQNTDDSSLKSLPFSTPYSSPLNPCFIEQFEQFRFKVDHLLIRDGLVPIMKFFLDFPEPIENDPILILPIVSRCFVPKAWHEKILFYENHSLVSRERLRNLHLYIPTITDHMMDENEVLGRFSSLLEEENFISIQLDFIGSVQIITNPILEERKFLFYRRIFGLLSDEILIGDKLEDFEDAKNMNQSAIFQFDQPTMVYDSYLFHFFSSRGAYFFLDTEFEGGQLVPLSPLHGQMLYSVQSVNEEAGSLYESLKQQMLGDTVTWASLHEALKQSI